MRTGISTASLFMRLYNEDALPLLDSLGAGTVEVFLETISEYGKDFSDLLVSRKGGLDVHSVHAYTMHYEPELFSVVPRSFDGAMNFYRQVLSSAKALGAGNYTMHGRARIKKSNSYDDYKAIGERLSLLARTSAEYGVDLCLENVAWSLYNRPGYYKAVSEYVPDLKVTLDIKQARISGYSYKDYIEECSGKIKTVHLSDVDDGGRICLPGKGVFDFEDLYKRLYDAGFDGCALIEVYSGDYGEASELKDSLDYLREIQYKIYK